MRVVFMGTPDFAVPSLERLIHEGIKPVAVVTAPDRPRGRGRKVSATPVKLSAQKHGIRIIQPGDVRDPEFAEEIKSLEPDIIAVVAFRILPPEVYTQARLGAFNLHASLLPRFRGAAPINRAIMAGARQTGVTTFFLRRKVDTGDMILRRKTSIGPNETAGELHDRLMLLGADAVAETVSMIASGSIRTEQQDDEGASQAPKIFPEDCEVPWAAAAKTVHDHIRGLSPYPGSWTLHRGKQIKVFRSQLSDGVGESGTVLRADENLRVACGEGAVDLVEIQLEGRRKMAAEEFLRGYALQPGEHLGG